MPYCAKCRQYVTFSEAKEVGGLSYHARCAPRSRVPKPAVKPKNPKPKLTSRTVTVSRPVALSSRRGRKRWQTAKRERLKNQPRLTREERRELRRSGSNQVTILR